MPIVLAVLFASVRLHVVVERFEKRIDQLHARREALQRDVQEKRHAIALCTEYRTIEPQARSMGLRPPAVGQVRVASWRVTQP